jgi:acetyl-CoA carboxylase carboxyl transferase subunit beta
MAWFKKTKKPKAVRADRRRSTVPEGLWVKCEGCKEIVYSRDLEQNLKVCPKCGYHFRIDANARIRLLLDDSEPDELFYGVSPTDPLGFKDTKRYRDRLKAYQQALGERDAVVVVTGRLDGIPVVLAVMEYRFMGGSMGSVVGEKITRAAETAREREQPLVVVSASGGARMQEGVLSLMQMAKIAAALHRLREARLPYLSVLTDPTTGGVTASFAMLGDLNIAEPGALIGFAGPRVIQQTIRQELPEGFQRSEFLLEHGMVDLVVDRRELKATLARALRFMGAAPAQAAPPLAVAAAGDTTQ